MGLIIVSSLAAFLLYEPKLMKMKIWEVREPQIHPRILKYQQDHKNYKERLLNSIKLPKNLCLIYRIWKISLCLILAFNNNPHH